MKFTTTLVLFALIAGIAAKSLNEHRFALVPNAEGQMHLVDLEAPEEPENFFNPDIDIRFMLYTRNNPTTGQRLILNDIESVRASHFNAAHKTRFTIHGWMGSEQSTVNRNVATQKFLVDDFNVRNIFFVKC